MNIERAVTLSADLMQRRTDLLRLFGARYQERTALAKERIKEVMAQQHTPNPLSAALINTAGTSPPKHPGEDVSTTQQFVSFAQLLTSPKANDP